jgi:hypothetical protein
MSENGVLELLYKYKQKFSRWQGLSTGRMQQVEPSLPEQTYEDNDECRQNSSLYKARTQQSVAVSHTLPHINST